MADYADHCTFSETKARFSQIIKLITPRARSNNWLIGSALDFSQAPGSRLVEMGREVAFLRRIHLFISRYADLVLH